MPQDECVCACTACRRSRHAPVPSPASESLTTSCFRGVYVGFLWNFCGQAVGTTPLLPAGATWASSAAAPLSSTQQLSETVRKSSRTSSNGVHLRCGGQRCRMLRRHAGRLRHWWRRCQHLQSTGHHSVCHGLRQAPAAWHGSGGPCFGVGVSALTVRGPAICRVRALPNTEQQEWELCRGSMWTIPLLPGAGRARSKHQAQERRGFRQH